jgi:hypothetical protein
MTQFVPDFAKAPQSPPQGHPQPQLAYSQTPQRLPSFAPPPAGPTPQPQYVSAPPQFAYKETESFCTESVLNHLDIQPNFARRRLSGVFNNPKTLSRDLVQDENDSRRSGGVGCRTGRHGRGGR